jgi:nicotinamidase/pyrazinamidase
MKTLTTVLGVLMTSLSVQATVVFHEVDTQLTFWESSLKNKAGPLAVNGSKNLERTISRIKKMAYKDKRVKAVASVDYHFDYEVQNPDLFPEFAQFPAHGMAKVKGPLGAARIPQVLVYPKDKIYYVDHNRYENDRWELVPQTLDAEKIVDDKYEVVIRKNGLGSYSVFANPRTEEIYSMIAPKAVFVYGVATDFCVDAAVKGFLERGYTTYVIEDAISGIFPDLVSVKTQEMKAMGAVFIKYEDVAAIVDLIEN